MTADDIVRRTAKVLISHPLGTVQGGTAAGAFVLCGCGTVINGASRDHAHARAREHVARAMADASLLAPAPLREEWAVEMGAGGPRELFDSRSAAKEFAHEDETVLHRHVTDWLPADGS